MYLSLSCKVNINFCCVVVVFSSRQLAEDVLKASEREQGEEEDEVVTGTVFEEMETLTRASETGEGEREQEEDREEERQHTCIVLSRASTQ